MHPNEFKFPGKCFLVGEYAVLSGGSAILLNLPPLFQANFKSQSSSNPFHPESPAGKYWQIHADFFSQYSIQFTDPHGGAGGLGASSAQFLALAFARGINSPWEAWEIYRSILRSQNTIPSGVDVVAQAQQQLGFFHIQAAQKIAQPLSDFLPVGETLYILRTKQKLATHEHLAVLDTKKIPLEEMQKITEQCLQKEMPLGGLLQEYGKILQSSGLVAEATQAILQQLKLPFVSGAKGSGAMGADLVVALVHNHARAEFEQRMQAKEIPILYSLGGAHE